ncbi:MAG TPA: hypothetical protein VFO39_10595 [Candidatus Sulfotelmatobacter sp.]|nr:hypothetical protein [Candidatus Sulfotelmatobacter sp.]
MPRIVTKVNEEVKPVVAGWEKVLDDLQSRIQELNKLVPIVQRKIKNGESWPEEKIKV